MRCGALGHRRGCKGCAFSARHAVARRASRKLNAIILTPIQLKVGSETPTLSSLRHGSAGLYSILDPGWTFRVLSFVIHNLSFLSHNIRYLLFPTNSHSILCLLCEKSLGHPVSNSLYILDNPHESPFQTIPLRDKTRRFLLGPFRRALKSSAGSFFAQVVLVHNELLCPFLIREPPPSGRTSNDEPFFLASPFLPVVSFLLSFPGRYFFPESPLLLR